MKDVLPLWQGVFCLAIGAVYLAAGYRLMRVMARVCSGILLFVVGVAVAQRLGAGPGVAFGAGAGAGILGFLVGDAYYFIHMGVTGAAGGAALAAVAAMAAGAAAGPITIAGAVVGALAAIVWERPIGILATSLIGGATAMAGVESVLVGTGVHAAHRFTAAYVALFLVLAFAGCLLQARTTKSLPPKGKPAPRR